MRTANLELFPRKDDFRVVALSSEDVKKKTDDFVAFREMVLQSERMYPGIGHWLEEKVFPELSGPGRVAWIGYESDRPAVSAVLKSGGRSKFCHLRIDERLQDIHLGELFFTLMALGSNKATEIHFTLPESLWENERRFFQSFGFAEAAVSATQYRGSERELLCAAPASRVLAHSIEKLPKLIAGFRLAGSDLATELLMSVKPRWATAIMSGRKKVELRKRFSEKWEGSTVGIYSSAPDGSLLGRIKIARVVKSTPQAIWREFATALDCSHEDFDGYVGGSETVVALVLEEPRPFLNPIPLSQVRYWLKSSPTPPQSFCSVDNEGVWGKALALAAIFNGRFASASHRQPTRAGRELPHALAG